MLDSDTRQRVLEAAGAIFAQKGLQATSVRDICKAAGANVSAVNYHFRSKEQLYLEAVRHAYRSVAERAPLPQNWPPETPPRQRLYEFVRALLNRVFSPPSLSWHLFLMMREVTAPTEACQELVRDFIRPMFDTLQGILGGLVPATLSPLQRGLLAASIAGQCLHYHYGRRILPLLLGEQEFQALTLERLAEHITSFSLAALEGLSAGEKRRGS
jgi:AcrR family transcriptional regulator